MTLFELDEAANKIRDEIEGDAKILVGTTLDPSLDGTIRVSVVATGIETEKQIVENSNDLGVTSKASVRENNRPIMDNRFTSGPGKNISDLGVDLSKKCIDICEINAQKFGLKNRVKFFKSDIDNFNNGKEFMIILMIEIPI